MKHLFIGVLLALNPPFTSVPLPKNDQLPEQIQESLSEMPPLNVYQMLANVPASFEPYVALAKSIFVEGKFNPRLREIAILRLAHDLKCPYEWHQHVFIAKSNGVTDQEIETIRKENPVKGLGKEENFICKVADEITLDGNLKDATFKELYSRYSIEEGSELIFAISFMNMLGRYINATRVQIEKTNPLEGLSSPMK